MNFFNFQLFYLITYNSAVYSLKNYIDLSTLMYLINNQHINKPLAGHGKGFRTCSGAFFCRDY